MYHLWNENIIKVKNKQKWAKQKMKSREQDCCGMLTVKTALLLSQPTGTQHAGLEAALAAGGILAFLQES